MAAAVPIDACDGPEARYRRRSGEPGELVLFSGHDMVLRPGYWAAELLYDAQEGPAVGATGKPQGRWLDDPVDTKLGHLRYWKSERAAELVGDFLAGIPMREAMVRAGPEERGREQPGREQAIREAGTREVGDGLVLRWQNCYDPP
jgi:hypothetical protein